MKKNLTLLLLLAAFAITASAQKKPSTNVFNLALQTALPVGDNQYNFGIGVSGQFEIPISPSTNFTAGLGYINFQIKDDYKKLLPVSNNISSHGYTNAMAGLKYYFSNQFYAAAQAGAAVGSKGGASTSFIYSPGIGCVFPLKNGNAFDIGARYEGWAQGSIADFSAAHTISFIGIHGAFKFLL